MASFGNGEDVALLDTQTVDDAFETAYDSTHPRQRKTFGASKLDASMILGSKRPEGDDGSMEQNHFVSTATTLCVKESLWDDDDGSIDEGHGSGLLSAGNVDEDDDSCCDDDLKAEISHSSCELDGMAGHAEEARSDEMGEELPCCAESVYDDDSNEPPRGHRKTHGSAWPPNDDDTGTDPSRPKTCAIDKKPAKQPYL
jgi:hypothetical protein